MKRSLLIAGALLTLGASTTHAQLNLAWKDCLPPNGTGVTNMNFACNMNTRVFSVYGSAIAPAGTAGIIGHKCVLDLVASGTTWPAWWRSWLPGSCRPNYSLMVSFGTMPQTWCMDDHFGDRGIYPLGGLYYEWGGAGSPPVEGNRARMRTVAVIDTNSALVEPLTPGLETYLFTIVLRTQQTVGVGACAGCNVPVCIVLSSCSLQQTGGNDDFLLTGPATSNYVTWQDGAGGGPFGGLECPAATPVRATTWGRVKTIYR